MLFLSKRLSMKAFSQNLSTGANPTYSILVGLLALKLPATLFAKFIYVALKPKSVRMEPFSFFTRANRRMLRRRLLRQLESSRISILQLRLRISDDLPVVAPFIVRRNWSHSMHHQSGPSKSSISF